ncbi:hypothetical protein [Sphingomonas aracearum]|uniref:Uncharacterized protein n=1 Tax=Sphingomonas aracearum TaxID=2283317 RepID=A0A369VU81_9SPHN|nr:hypothetical protein [Sphingomonas aracearum]RDE05643.1 hypothetical protein DVW87_10510 [Sphingomonas aracearum]
MTRNALPSSRRASALWVVLLTLASAGTTLVLACATPFAALAALAATRMRTRDGFALIALAWLASQLIGFCVLDYPRDPLTFTWGAAMLTAALAAVAAARWGARANPSPLVSLATAFGTGFVAYKAALVAWSLVLGGVHTALSPYWALRQFGREALILAGLMLAYQALVRLGVPAPRRTSAPTAA